MVVPVDLGGILGCSDEKIVRLPTFERLSVGIQEAPDLYRQCIGLAAHYVVHTVRKEMHFPDPDKPILVHLLNHTPVLPMKSLKSNVVGKLVSIKGTVVRVGVAKSVLREMKFACTKCGASVTASFADGMFTPPTRCSINECRGRTFNPIRSTAVSAEWQKIRIQEILTDYEDSGRIPRTVDCDLTDDLVDTCSPGDVVTVTGVVRVSSVDAEGASHFRSKKKDANLFLIYICAYGMVAATNQSRKEATEVHQFTDREMEAIQKIARQPNLFSLLVNSLCPPIYGHEMVKAGFLLSLFGGTPRSSQKGLSIRSDIHILVVGDPGLGKSQMLRSVASISPRGVYVSGRATTNSGLTVTVVKEGNDFALEAGALVMADMGTCCIDEFDKMGNEHQALLEAMEQQTISIAKGGLICQLRAKTSVMAAANPCGGHYNRAKTVSENLKISPMILSRFDLVFILLDQVDEEKDTLLSEHLMALFAGAKRDGEAGKAAGLLGGKSQDDPYPLSTAPQSEAPGDTPLISRLSAKCTDPIPPWLLRKYIAYARQHSHPHLTDGARDVLREFYMSLRRSHNRYDSTPITTRQLESLVRLSEARAKCELREEVTDKDALDVIAVLKESLFQSLADETGHIDFTRASGMSRSKEVNCMARALNSYCTRRNSALVTIMEIQTLAQEIGLKGNIGELIERLNQAGYLLKRPNSVYKFVASETGD